MWYNNAVLCVHTLQFTSVQITHGPYAISDAITQFCAYTFYMRTDYTRSVRNMWYNNTVLCVHILHAYSLHTHGPYAICDAITQFCAYIFYMRTVYTSEYFLYTLAWKPSFTCNLSFPMFNQDLRTLLFSKQNARQIGQGIHELWSNVQRDTQTNTQT